MTWQSKQPKHSDIIISPVRFIAPVGHTLLQATQGFPHSVLLLRKFSILTFPNNPSPAPKGHKYLQKNLSIIKHVINRKLAHKTAVLGAINLKVIAVLNGSIL